MRKFWTGVFQNRKRKVLEQKLLAQVDRTKLPRHLAIIMDGNGRWAQKRGLPRTAGHRYGVEALRKVIEASVELGIPVLTVYAFLRKTGKGPRGSQCTYGLIVEYLQKELESASAEYKNTYHRFH